MNATLKTVKTPETAAAIPITTTPSRSAEAAVAAGPARRDPRPWRDDSEQFREDLLSRYDAPFLCHWQHTGLND